MVRSKSVTRVLMAKRVANAWLDQNASVEFRVTAYGSEGLKNLPGLLRAFRDEKVRIAELSDKGSFQDLGLESGFDKLTIWSKNREGMLALDAWLRAKGCETTGIW